MREPSPSPSITRRRFLAATAVAAGAVAVGGAAVVLARARGRVGWNRDATWVGARREFFRGPFSADDLRSLASGGVRPVVSYKPDRSWGEVAAGGSDADLDAMHEALLEAGLEADVAFHHEPENDEAGHPNAAVPRGTAADYAAAARRFAERVTDGTDGRYVLCLMSSGYEASPERWECGAEEAYAVDAYNQFGARSDVWRTLAELIDPMLSFASARGIGSGVWECNAMEDPADPERKAAWITGAADLAEEAELESLLFFDGGDYDWSLLSSSRAERAVLRAARRSYFVR